MADEAARINESQAEAYKSRGNSALKATIRKSPKIRRWIGNVPKRSTNVVNAEVEMSMIARRGIDVRPGVDWI